MKPLYWIAIGLIVVVFTGAPDDKWDVAEIVGNAFVLIGWVQLSRALPDLPLRLTLSYLAVLALVVAAATSPPDARAWLDDAEPAVVWASSLPALGFQAVLCHALAGRAQARRVRSGVWWRIAEVAIVLALVANPLADGAGWTWLKDIGIGAVGLAGVLLVIILCIAHGPATWAGGPPPPPEPAEPAEPEKQT
ncbi:hypothetical protein ACFQ0K_08105 [Nocardioides caeni]|uniref:Uncharacterized protein n=1 Tax=Nocardioides caeni TaxID=574700 RepID=A0A4S8N3I8_9ACTN|nr:hypothetical protein [Nocardioides caeni]THV10091.1 hypothetical protein E9934_14855 [Nocardioides caeni]